MDKNLMETISLPDDSILKDEHAYFRKNAKELVTGKANPDEVAFVVTNLKTACTEAKNDFLPNTYGNPSFVINVNGKWMNMLFDKESLPHLFGIFEEEYKKSSLYSFLIKKIPNLKQIMEDKKIDTLGKLCAMLDPSLINDIVNYECSEQNINNLKINWQKLMIKIFDMVNVGLLEDNKCFLYKESRNKYSTGPCSYILVRSLRNGELEDSSNKNKDYYDKQLFIELVETEIKGSIYLVPRSISLVDKRLNAKGERDIKPPLINVKGNKNAKPGDLIPSDYGVKTNDRVYKFAGIPQIERISEVKNEL